MTCLIKGCNFVLKNIPHEAFVYQKDSDPEFKFQTNHPNIFPYLLVNIGSGVSIVKVRRASRGGAWGLGSNRWGACHVGAGWATPSGSGDHGHAATWRALVQAVGGRREAQTWPSGVVSPMSGDLSSGPTHSLSCACTSRWRQRTDLSGSVAAPSAVAPSGALGLCSPKQRYPRLQRVTPNFALSPVSQTFPRRGL